MEYLKRGHEKISAIQEKEVHVHIEKTRIYYFSGKCKQTNKKQVALLFLYESQLMFQKTNTKANFLPSPDERLSAVKVALLNATRKSQL